MSLSLADFSKLEQLEAAVIDRSKQASVLRADFIRHLNENQAMRRDALQQIEACKQIVAKFEATQRRCSDREDELLQEILDTEGVIRSCASTLEIIRATMAQDQSFI